MLFGFFGFAFIPLVMYLIARQKHKAWLAYPTLEHYWKIHPECHTKNGVKCYNCGSKHTRNYGWKNGVDGRRIHKCHQCESFLYRTGSWGQMT